MKIYPRQINIQEGKDVYELNIKNSATDGRVLLFKIRRSEHKVVEFSPKMGYAEAGVTTKVQFRVVDRTIPRTRLLVKLVVLKRSALESSFERSWEAGARRNGEVKKVIDVNNGTVEGVDVGGVGDLNGDRNAERDRLEHTPFKLSLHSRSHCSLMSDTSSLSMQQSLQSGAYFSPSPSGSLVSTPAGSRHRLLDFSESVEGTVVEFDNFSSSMRSVGVEVVEVEEVEEEEEEVEVEAEADAEVEAEVEVVEADAVEETGAEVVVETVAPCAEEDRVQGVEAVAAAAEAAAVEPTAAPPAAAAAAESAVAQPAAAESAVAQPAAAEPAVTTIGAAAAGAVVGAAGGGGLPDQNQALLELLLKLAQSPNTSTLLTQLLAQAQSQSQTQTIQTQADTPQRSGPQGRKALAQAQLDKGQGRELGVMRSALMSVPQPFPSIASATFSTSAAGLASDSTSAGVVVGWAAEGDEGKEGEVEVEEEVGDIEGVIEGWVGEIDVDCCSRLTALKNSCTRNGGGDGVRDGQREGDGYDNRDRDWNGDVNGGGYGVGPALLLELFGPLLTHHTLACVAETRLLQARQGRGRVVAIEVVGARVSSLALSVGGLFGAWEGAKNGEGGAGEGAGVGTSIGTGEGGGTGEEGTTGGEGELQQRLSDIHASYLHTNLRHLQFRSHLTHIDPSIHLFQHLTSLHLGDNKIRQLDCPLNLPLLQTLDLSGNLLTSLDFLQALSSLRSLSAARNRLSSLHLSVNMLISLPLVSLDLSQNPVCEEGLYAGEVVRALPRVRHFDGFDVEAMGGSYAHMYSGGGGASVGSGGGGGGGSRSMTVGRTGSGNKSSGGRRSPLPVEATRGRSGSSFCRDNNGSFSGSVCGQGSKAEFERRLRLALDARKRGASAAASVSSAATAPFQAPSYFSTSATAASASFHAHPTYLSAPLTAAASTSHPLSATAAASASFYASTTPTHAQSPLGRGRGRRASIDSPPPPAPPPRDGSRGGGRDRDWEQWGSNTNDGGEGEGVWGEMRALETSTMQLDDSRRRVGRDSDGDRSRDGKWDISIEQLRAPVLHPPAPFSGPSSSSKARPDRYTVGTEAEAEVSFEYSRHSPTGGPAPTSTSVSIHASAFPSTAVYEGRLLEPTQALLLRYQNLPLVPRFKRPAPTQGTHSPHSSPARDTGRGYASEGETRKTRPPSHNPSKHSDSRYLVQEQSERYKVWDPRYLVPQPVFGFSKPFIHRRRPPSQEHAWGTEGSMGAPDAHNALHSEGKAYPSNYGRAVVRMRGGGTLAPSRGTFSRADKGLQAGWFPMDWAEVEANRREGLFDPRVGVASREGAPTGMGVSISGGQSVSGGVGGQSRNHSMNQSANLSQSMGQSMNQSINTSMSRSVSVGRRASWGAHVSRYAYGLAPQHADDFSRYRKRHQGLGQVMGPGQGLEEGVGPETVNIDVAGYVVLGETREMGVGAARGAGEAGAAGADMGQSQAPSWSHSQSQLQPPHLSPKGSRAPDRAQGQALARGQGERSAYGTYSVASDSVAPVPRSPDFGSFYDSEGPEPGLLQIRGDMESMGGNGDGGGSGVRVPDFAPTRTSAPEPDRSISSVPSVLVFPPSPGSWALFASEFPHSAASVAAAASAPSLASAPAVAPVSEHHFEHQSASASVSEYQASTSWADDSFLEEMRPFTELPDIPLSTPFSAPATATAPAAAPTATAATEATDTYAHSVVEQGGGEQREEEALSDYLSWLDNQQQINTDADVYTDAYVDTHTDAEAGAHADVHTNTNTDMDTHAQADSQADVQAQDMYIDKNADAYTDTYTDASFEEDQDPVSDAPYAVAAVAAAAAASVGVAAAATRGVIAPTAPTVLALPLPSDTSGLFSAPANSTSLSKLYRVSSIPKFKESGNVDSNSSKFPTFQPRPSNSTSISNSNANNSRPLPLPLASSFDPSESLGQGRGRGQEQSMGQGQIQGQGRVSGSSISFSSLRDSQHSRDGDGGGRDASAGARAGAAAGVEDRLFSPHKNALRAEQPLPSQGDLTSSRNPLRRIFKS